MNNSQLRAFVRQLIVEAKEAKAKKPEFKKKKVSVSDHIKMIDEAGDKAATQAKTAEVDKMIQAIEHIKSTIGGLEHFDKVVGANTAKTLTTDLEKSLAELNKKKEELTKQVGNAEKVDDKNKPVRVTPDNAVKADKDIPGQGISEVKKIRLKNK